MGNILASRNLGFIEKSDEKHPGFANCKLCKVCSFFLEAFYAMVFIGYI
jgi:hypothetical protein